MFCYCVFLVQAEYPYFSANLKDWQHSKIHKNENIQMCNKIPVATTFISPASDFTPSHDWNVLSSRKISLCLLNRSFFILLHIRNCPFVTRILCFTTKGGCTTCSCHLVFARTILNTFSSVVLRLAHAQFMRLTL